MCSSDLFPAACPGCGVIFAKLAETPIRATPSVSEADAGVNGANAAVKGEHTSHESEEAVGTLIARGMELMFYVPSQVSRANWFGRIALLALITVWTYFIWRDMNIPAGDMGSRVLHIILTPFHEAGHYLIFRWFGEFIMILEIGRAHV